MEKVKVTIRINDYKIETTGSIENDIINVSTNDEIINFDMKKLILNRKTNEIIMTLDFINETLKYQLKETNKEFSNKIIVLSLTNSDKEYNIMYQMEQNVFTLKIKYEKD